MSQFGGQNMLGGCHGGSAVCSDGVASFLSLYWIMNNTLYSLLIGCMIDPRVYIEADPSTCDTLLSLYVKK